MRITQTQTILKAFKENENELTPSDILRLGIAQYNARIFELKRAGHVIENIDLGTHNGVRHTKFIYQGKRENKSLPSEKPQNFPSKAHEFAHLNSLNSHKNQDQLIIF